MSDVAIGISDILSWLDCPRRMSYGMKRHVDRDQDASRTPEARNPQAAYGSAIHFAIQATEDGTSDHEAVSLAVKLYGWALGPEEVQLLRDDLALYHQRDFPETRTVLSEDEIRVPLVKHRDQWIFFRARIDRLYSTLNDPGTFIHVDYKSSRWPKTRKEVRDDLQMRAYDWAIHEYLPEVEHLIQVYDQLRAGQIELTRGARSRARIYAWLKEIAPVVLDDDERGEDGLLLPTFNQWCPWCPIKESCPVVDDLSDWAQTGLDTSIDARGRMEIYVDRMARAAAARKLLESYEGSVKDRLKHLPPAERAALGFEVRSRRSSKFGPRALEALHGQLGRRFYDIANVTKASLDELDDDEKAWALGLLDEGESALLGARRDQ